MAVTQTEVAFGHVDSKLARSFPKGKAKVNQAEVNDIQGSNWYLASSGPAIAC